MKERGFGKGLTIITAIILFAIVIASAVLTVVIKSANNGNVVNDLELPLLTEKFKRGSNTTDKDGVGLGLYISKTFINAMDGILEVENANPGFKVILKLRII